jgi:hypothetical protein
MEIDKYIPYYDEDRVESLDDIAEVAKDEECEVGAYEAIPDGERPICTHAYVRDDYASDDCSSHGRECKYYQPGSTPRCKYMGMVPAYTFGREVIINAKGDVKYVDDKNGNGNEDKTKI